MEELRYDSPDGDYVVVLKPTTRRRDSDQMLAPRPSTLNGRVVALLDNVKANADEVLNQIERRLCERFESVEIVRLGKSSASNSAERMLPPGDYAKLLDADAVVTALGD
ncbi:MAG: hypothetical protein HY329_06970 [Chloroflexi bacterium]|nr:hypothetical protein [Chloroflexota bacterium]